MGSTPRRSKPVQFKINLTEELRELLERSAGEAHRSIANEIVYRLECTYDREKLIDLVRGKSQDRASIVQAEDDVDIAEFEKGKMLEERIERRRELRQIIEATTEDRFDKLEKVQKMLVDKVDAMPEMIRRILTGDPPKKK